MTTPDGTEALEGRVALISGGARGIGRAVAAALVGAGARVALLDPGVAIDGEDADPSVAEAAARDLGGLALPWSVATPKGAEAAVAATRERFGGLDIVVHAAAILRDGFLFKADPFDWEAVIGTNLSGAFHLLRAAAPVIRDQARIGRTGGRVVLFTSTAGLHGNYGQAAYAAAKAGLTGLARVAALDLARSGATANAIAPFAATRVTQSIRPANEAQAAYKARALSVPVEPVADLALALCRDGAVTGQLFGVRGREVLLFAPSRPAARHIGSPAEAVRALAPSFVPLESDLDAFSGDPVL